MNDQLYRDAQARPSLFSWNGGVDQHLLEQWISGQRLRIPIELKDLWRWTGGGELFETETLLKPIINETNYDSVMTINAKWRQRGLSDRYLIFHIGMMVSAVRSKDGFIVELDEDSLTEKRVFPSLEAWYSSAIRAEYANRYGLEPLPRHVGRK